jgi:hypothetical protein
MVAPVHKNTNAPLILLVCDVILVCWQHIIGDLSRFFEGASTTTFLNDFFAFRCAQNNLGLKKSLVPFEKPLEIACAAYIGIGGMKIENEPRH